MKNIGSLAMLALSLILFACSSARHSLDDPARVALTAKIESLVSAAYPDPAAPGCAVLVRLDGETIFSRAYGLANLETREPNTTATSFRLASVTKQFTAAAILRLVDQGKLRLDESLSDLFPGFPDYGRSITIRHLLGHTSGIRGYEDLMPKDTTVPILDAGVLDIMREQTGGNFAPGDKYSYSNSGYAVLAMIVEARSGKRFADFLHDELFEPLGMTDTVAFEKGRSEVSRRAYGYRRNDDGTFRFADQSMTSSVLGDGGIYCSVENYAKWAEAWFDGRVLSPESQALAWTPGTLNDGSATEYGLGWRIDVIDGIKRVHHTGGTTGFNNCVRLVPERRLLVAFLSNRNGEEPKELAERIERLALR